MAREVQTFVTLRCAVHPLTKEGKQPTACKGAIKGITKTRQKAVLIGRDDKGEPIFETTESGEIVTMVTVVETEVCEAIWGPIEAALKTIPEEAFVFVGDDERSPFRVPGVVTPVIPAQSAGKKKSPVRSGDIAEAAKAQRLAVRRWLQANRPEFNIGDTGVLKAAYVDVFFKANPNVVRVM